MLDKIISIEEYYKEAKKVVLDESDYSKFLNGVVLDLETNEKIVRIYLKNTYKGLGIVEDNKLKRYIIE